MFTNFDLFVKDKNKNIRRVEVTFDDTLLQDYDNYEGYYQNSGPLYPLAGYTECSVYFEGERILTRYALCVEQEAVWDQKRAYRIAFGRVMKDLLKYIPVEDEEQTEEYFEEAFENFLRRLDV